MVTDSENLLDLFIICNVPSNKKFYLVCRKLYQIDEELFEGVDTEKYDIPYEYEAEEYYNKAYWEHMTIEGIHEVGGFPFGVYESYEEAVTAAKSYSAKKLLDKFRQLYKAAVKAKEKEDKQLKSQQEAAKKSLPTN